MDPSTQAFRDTPELHLIYESRIKNKTVESWSTKDKNVIFL